MHRRGREGKGLCSGLGGGVGVGGSSPHPPVVLRFQRCHFVTAVGACALALKEVVLLSRQAPDA